MQQRNGNSGGGGSNAFEFVPSAVVERAFVHDMVYAACPKCSASLQSQMQVRVNGGSVALSSAITTAPAVLSIPADTVECAACRARTLPSAVQYKYRLKIRVAYGSSVVDAMLFDEVAQELIGASAVQLQRLQLQYPSLPWLLEELLTGLRVSFRCQRPQNRATSTGAAPMFTKDLKIIMIAPLASVLLPQSPVSLAMEVLGREHHQRALFSTDEDTDE